MCGAMIGVQALIAWTVLRYKNMNSFHWLFAILMAELVAFALYALGITMPAIFITYSIGTK
jgi:hypothetical protein